MQLEHCVGVCPDCAAQYPLDKTHSCDQAGQRLAAELIDRLITSPDVEDGIGLLWLYRVGFRLRSRLNGLKKYEDRARLARRVCVLMEVQRVKGSRE